VSKKKGASKKRRKQARAKRNAKHPASLLAAVAAALNACEQAGLHPRFRHGAAYCYHGVVLPPLGKQQKWEARVFRAIPQSPPGGGGD
jgi:hypothetical protein